MEASTLDLLWVGKTDPPSITGLEFHRPTKSDSPVQAIALDDAALLDEATIRRAGVTPVVGFATADRESDGRIELWIDPTDPEAGKSVIQYVSKVWRRLSPSLCRASANSPHLAVMAYAYSRRMELVPVLNPKIPTVVDYPDVMRFADGMDVLFDLFDAGLLTRRKIDELPVCPNCQGSRALAREICVQCGRAILTKSRIVHHYRCGYQGPEADFSVEDGEGMACPKCQYRLQHYGRDHDQSGVLIECQACDSSMSEPEVGFRCLDCGVNTRGDNVEFKPVWQYAVSSNAAIALALLKEGKEDSLLELLRGDRDGNRALEESTRLLGDGNKTSVTFGIEIALRDGAAAPALADAYDRIYTLLNRAMRDSDIISVEMNAPTNGIFVTALGDSADRDAIVDRTTAWIADCLEDDAPVDVTVRQLGQDTTQLREFDRTVDLDRSHAD